MMGFISSNNNLYPMRLIHMLLTYYNGIENIPTVVLDAYPGENTFITNGIFAPKYTRSLVE